MTISLKIALCSIARHGSSAASFESASPSFCSSPRGLGRNREAQHGIGQFQAGQGEARVVLGRVHHRVVHHIVDLRDRADVAGDPGVDLDVFLPLKREQVADLHRLARVSDVELGVLRHRAPMDPEHSELAHEGVDRDLEDMGDGRAARIGSNLDRLSRGIAKRRAVRLDRAGHDLLDHLGELRDPRTGLRRREAHRYEMALAQRFLERIVEPVRLQHLAFEVKFHERLVDLDDLVDDPGMGFVHRREVGRPVPRREEAIDDAPAALRREVDGQALAAERIDEARELRFEIDFVDVDLVHHDHACESALPGGFHHAPGDHLDPLFRVHDDRHGLHRREDGQCPSEEIGITGGIDQIHVPGAALEARNRGIQRMLVLLLLRLEVAHRGAFRHAPGRTDDPGVCEQRLHQSRLAGGAVP